MAQMSLEELYRGESAGDTVSGMTDDMSSSSYVRWNENDNA